MAEFRITFSIQQGDADETDFWEIGFGSSSAWSSIDAALHDIESAIQNRQWETEDGMPDPAAADDD